MALEQIQQIIDEVAAKYETELSLDEVFQTTNFTDEIIRGLAIAAAQKKTGKDVELEEEEEKIDLSQRGPHENLSAAVESLKGKWGTPEGAAEFRKRRGKG